MVVLWHMTQTTRRGMVEEEMGLLAQSMKFHGEQQANDVAARCVESYLYAISLFLV